MNKQTIGYSESIETFNPATGLKKWVKIWRDKEIDNDEDPHRAFEEVKTFVQNKFHKENNPQLVEGVGMQRPNLGHEEPSYQTFPPIFPQTIQSVDYKAKERLEILIDDAKSNQELMPLVNDIIKLGLEKQYFAKLQSLQK